ncbi:uncharacterized protein LOC117146091 [Drosophila mauritiana]|uniref:Uncharacterized protein LOC117146091 n=1 Tax=Drosophila mauritiana TaxID=7226 RepID=A0A6P8KKY9_DROMA|nr:uncharacterized protein LOC117146091 [Drosophila mauritiana]
MGDSAKKRAGEGTGGHGSGPGPTGNRMGTRTIAGVPAASPEGSFNNKSHDRHGNTEMLFLGLPLPSHGNSPRPPCERKSDAPCPIPHPIQASSGELELPAGSRWSCS